MSVAAVLALVIVAALGGAGLGLWWGGRRAQQRDPLAALTDHLDDAVVLVGADDTITYANHAAAALAGRPSDAIVGTAIAGWIARPDRPAMQAALARVRALPRGQASRILGRLEHPSEGPRTVRGRAYNPLGPTGREVALVLRDITVSEALEEGLGRRAFWDSLTGLPNRDLFTDRLAHALERLPAATPSYLLVIGVDDLRSVNEGLDLAAGDQLLRTLAERIQVSLRPDDTPARLTGDAFAVLVERPASPGYAAELGERLSGMVRLPISIGELTITATAAIGMTVLGADTTVETAISEAETAMYQAKATRTAGVVSYDDSLRRGAATQLHLRMELPRALHQGQFRAAYQPIHATSGAALRGSALAGFEALARWPHPGRGPVSPAEFIPAAEASGMIGELGRWILGEACQQAALWNAGADRYSMSVNVSGEQLGDPQLAEHLSAALEAADLPAELLIVELTESVLVDTAGTIDALAALREVGVGIAIDDFGTGYSSLAYLQRFPVTRLKVDRAFTVEICTPSGRKLVRGILDLARELGLSTVAEGVETRAQLEALAELGCDYVQGYLLGRPQGPEDLADVL
ncbi:MAG: phosphodiesterase [Microthrixaceae bacterium]